MFAGSGVSGKPEKPESQSVGPLDERMVRTTVNQPASQPVWKGCVVPADTSSFQLPFFSHLSLILGTQKDMHFIETRPRRRRKLNEKMVFSTSCVRCSRSRTQELNLDRSKIDGLDTQGRVCSCVTGCVIIRQGLDGFPIEFPPHFEARSNVELMWNFKFNHARSGHAPDAFTIRE